MESIISASPFPLSPSPNTRTLYVPRRKRETCPSSRRPSGTRSPTRLEKATRASTRAGSALVSAMRRPPSGLSNLAWGSRSATRARASASGIPVDSRESMKRMLALLLGDDSPEVGRHRLCCVNPAYSAGHRIRPYYFIDSRLDELVVGLPEQDRVDAGSDDLPRPALLEELGRGRDGPPGRDDVVDHDVVPALGVELRRRLHLDPAGDAVPAFLELDRLGPVQRGERLRPLRRARVRGDHYRVVKLDVRLDVLGQAGDRGDAVDGHREQREPLCRVHVDRADPRDSHRPQQVGDYPEADYLSGEEGLALPGVTEVGDDRVDPRPLLAEVVGGEEELHVVPVRRRIGRLDEQDLEPVELLVELVLYLAAGELGRRHSEQWETHPLGWLGPELLRGGTN